VRFGRGCARLTPAPELARIGCRAFLTDDDQAAVYRRVCAGEEFGER
jgi:hypothetical protein